MFSISVDGERKLLAGVSGCALIINGEHAIKDNKMALRTVDPGIEYFLFRPPYAEGKGWFQ